MRIEHAGGVKAPSIPEDLERYKNLCSKNISILIGTPTLDNQCSMDYTTSLLQSCIYLRQLGIPFFFAKTLNSCFVDLSRNLMVTQFMNSKCTHLWQIDSDMSWNPEAPLEMLLKGKDFIAGIGRKKVDDTDFAGSLLTLDGQPYGELGETEEDVILKMQHIGGAFTIHSRRTFDLLAEKHPELKSDGTGKGGYAFYQCEYTSGQWKTEDYFFCDLCHDVGIDVWCYPNIDMGHEGQKNYKGNYFKYLKSLKRDLPEIKNQYANG